MESSRRNFLKIAGISALGLAATPVLNAYTAAEKPKSNDYTFKRGPKALLAKRWGMVIDLRKLTSAAATAPMIEVCNKIHNIPHFSPRHEIKWIWEVPFDNAFIDQPDAFLNGGFSLDSPAMVLCNHCDNPPCVRACPTQATFKRESDGIVMMDYHRCIGCRFCMAACPFGSRSFNFRDPRGGLPKPVPNPDYPTRTKGVVEKCDFCVERLAVGEMPACVEASNGIMAFGDLEDPNSNVRKLLATHYAIRRKVELGTGPSVFYIVGAAEKA